MIGASQIAAFDSDGFLRLGAMTTPDELDTLRRICDGVLETWAAKTRAFAAFGGEMPDDLTTVVSPESIAPELAQTQLAANVRRVAAAVLRCEASEVRAGWRMFVKPAGAHGTPWHQDGAYRPAPHTGASVFVPLDPLSTSNCIKYARGSHMRGLRPHAFEHGHHIAANVDGDIVECRLAPGEAAMHHCLTLHSTGPNDSPAARRALAIVLQPETRRAT